MSPSRAFAEAGRRPCSSVASLHGLAVSSLEVERHKQRRHRRFQVRVLAASRSSTGVRRLKSPALPLFDGSRLVSGSPARLVLGRKSPCAATSHDRKPFATDEGRRSPGGWVEERNSPTGQRGSRGHSGTPRPRLGPLGLSLDLSNALALNRSPEDCACGRERERRASRLAPSRRAG